MQRTIPELFFETVEKFSDKKALLFKAEGVYCSITFQELSEKVKCFASSLQQLGIEREDKIPILLHLILTWFFSLAGVLTQAFDADVGILDQRQNGQAGDSPP